MYCSEAQKIANADSTNEYTSSLPFGIQWDLVCKFLEVKTDLTYADIATQSIWGNYYDTTYTPNQTAKYSEDDGQSFETVYVNETDQFKKTEKKYILLTTGAIEEITGFYDGVFKETVTTIKLDASPMNIYDFAGNVMEWTLEYGNTSELPCVCGGGYSWDEGNVNAKRNQWWFNDYDISFRATLY